MLWKRHYDIVETVPKVGDIIYVPSFKADLTREITLENCDKEGGAAKVNRVIKNHLGHHYVTVEEFTGYFEINWEKELKYKQKELAKKYGYNRAFIKNQINYDF